LFLNANTGHFDHPTSHDELCRALGLSLRGSLHKHIQALIEAGLVEPMDCSHRGIRLVDQGEPEAGFLFLGRIAAGRSIEAITQPGFMQVPDELLGNKPCYVMQVCGDSMIEEGVLNGDYVVIERRERADNGDIVVSLVNNEEATLKRIEKKPGQVVLHPANATMKPMSFSPDTVQIKGVLRGLLRSYQ
jgi:repressor LexA